MTKLISIREQIKGKNFVKRRELHFTFYILHSEGISLWLVCHYWLLKMLNYLIRKTFSTYMVALQLWTLIYARRQWDFKLLAQSLHILLRLAQISVLSMQKSTAWQTEGPVRPKSLWPTTPVIIQKAQFNPFTLSHKTICSCVSNIGCYGNARMLLTPINF